MKQVSLKNRYNTTNVSLPISTEMEKTTIDTALANDTMKGLSADPKYLLPRYFYDDTGSRIFQDIMQMPEYYLTECEYEIFSSQTSSIAMAFMEGTGHFDLIEFGSGDGEKTAVLLKYLTDQSADFTFITVDISMRANRELVKRLRSNIPGIQIEAKTGDYFRVMKKMDHAVQHRRIIFFLGSNIGNFSDTEINAFLLNLSRLTRKNDRVLIGYDLKKSPSIILKAYNDPYGHTRRFNLNHLARINRELDADFNLERFEHHPEYNPIAGEMKSYLVSTTDQTIHIGALEKSFHFRKWEPIFMELSRKFDLETIGSLAETYGFRVVNNFTDSRNFFVDSLWLRE